MIIQRKNPEDGPGPEIKARMTKTAIAHKNQKNKENTMDALTLAQEIIDGRRITREDDLNFFLTCDLKELCEGADRIRKACVGDKVDLCSIINGRSGRCPEDCKYCAQSAHHHTSCEVYDFLPEEEIVKMCHVHEEEGVDRFSIVTSGRALTGEEFDKAIHAYETMKKECKIDLCASMGFVTAEQLHHKLPPQHRDIQKKLPEHLHDSYIRHEDQHPKDDQGRGYVRMFRRHHRNG